MRYCKGNPYKSGKVRCDTCAEGNQFIDEHEFFYRCTTCDSFDMCRACALVQANILKIDLSVTRLHPHPVRKVRDTKSGWICDAVERPDLGGCESGVYDYGQTAHI